MRILILFLFCFSLFCENRSFPISSLSRVVDGDTVVVNLDLGFDLTYICNTRLDGIDTPERNTEEGRIVSLKVQEWFDNNQILTFVHRGKDKYGRNLGVIVNDKGISLNDYLVAEGFARVYNGGERTPWTQEQIDLILSKK
jgi:micrococcal nuclease